MGAARDTDLARLFLAGFAFILNQDVEWDLRDDGYKVEHMGFRNMQDLTMLVRVLRKCPCIRALGRANEVAGTVDGILGRNASAGFVVVYPPPGSDVSKTPEMVFKRGDTLYLFVTDDGAARWFGMSLFVQFRGPGLQFLRGPRCCIQCAIDAISGPACVLLLRPHCERERYCPLIGGTEYLGREQPGTERFPCKLSSSMAG